MPEFAFDLLSTSSTARRGRIKTQRGSVETPAFMPVGTQATVKTLLPTEIESVGSQIILSNTYHLMLRPGVNVIEGAGGLHEFMMWERPLLTDSGGFQVFSLGKATRVREECVTFQSHIDGSTDELSPEKAIELQIRFGSDIMMPLDHLIGLPATRKRVQDATERTHRWLDRSIVAHRNSEAASKGALFGICQGGDDHAMRRDSAQYIAAADVSGSAIGGLSVGESKQQMGDTLEVVCPQLPERRPRYLMGVGSPEDLWDCVSRGVDMFDCVLPTRLARNGALLTQDGRIDIAAKRYKDSHSPIDDACLCVACQQFTAAYIHHLFRAKELLALRLATLHNLTFMMTTMERIRVSIEHGVFDEAHREFDGRYRAIGTHE